ncbi:MAG: acyl-CoA thioesterase [Acidimicrobiales bacterium]
MDARTFLGIAPQNVALAWKLEVTPEVSTPGKFLYGGCGLGAALVALEQASGRETAWATAQYLSFAETGSSLDLEVTLAVSGKYVTQGRAIGRVQGREILTVNAALGHGDLEIEGTWVKPPVVPPPADCAPRRIPQIFGESVLNRVEVRVASGRMMEDVDGTPGTGSSSFWARLPGHFEPSAATLAIIGDYVASGINEPLGMRTMGRSLDNTIRVARLVPTEWILCDIRMHALAHGIAQGLAHLWSEDGVLLATASQSLSVRLWPEGFLDLSR